MKHVFRTRAFFVSIFLQIVAFNYSHAQKNISSQDHRVVRLNSPEKQIDAIVTTNKIGHVNKTKQYYWYNDNIINHTQGAYFGYALDGIYTEIAYPSKVLLCKGKYKNGLKTGEWLYWYENGNLKLSQDWKDGILQGLVCSYNEKGEQIKCEKYKSGAICVPKPSIKMPFHKRVASSWNGLMIKLHIKKREPVNVKN
jgi:hypothetical protein